jgi:hypothetical protein
MQKKHLSLEAVIPALVLLGIHRASFLGIVRLGYFSEQGNPQLLARQLVSKRFGSMEADGKLALGNVCIHFV